MEDILLSFVALQVLHACGGRLNGRLVSLPGLTLAGELRTFVVCLCFTEAVRC